MAEIVRQENDRHPAPSQFTLDGVAVAEGMRESLEEVAHVPGRERGHPSGSKSG